MGDDDLESQSSRVRGKREAQLSPGLKGQERPRVGKVNGEAAALSDSHYGNSTVSPVISAKCSIFSVWITD